MSRPTKAQRRVAQANAAFIAQLMQCDLVKVELPDGERLLVKGRDALDAVIASGTARQMSLTVVPMPCIEAAAALETLLGGDGFYSTPSQVGHA